MSDHTASFPAPSARPWTAVWALLLGAFVSLLDVTVVNFAIPEIARDLETSGTQAQWVLLAYLLPLAALLLPMGRFGDALGRRRLFLAGIFVFTLGACFAGFAQSITALILARTFQGIGAATMMPQIFALIHVILPPGQRRRAMGYFGMVSALGAIAGPIIGGVVLEVNPFDLGWRVVFLMVLPPCAAHRARTELPATSRRRFTGSWAAKSWSHHAPASNPATASMGPAGTRSPPVGSGAAPSGSLRPAEQRVGVHPGHRRFCEHRERHVVGGRTKRCDLSVGARILPT